jgi:hypothetical protein
MYWVCFSLWIIPLLQAHVVLNRQTEKIKGGKQMNKNLDCRGLACPQPVINTKKRWKE